MLVVSYKVYKHNEMNSPRAPIAESFTRDRHFEFQKISNVLRKMCGLVCFVYLCAYPSGLVCCGLLVVPVVIVGDFKFHVRRQCLLIRSVNFRTTRKNDLPPAHARTTHFLHQSLNVYVVSMVGAPFKNSYMRTFCK